MMNVYRCDACGHNQLEHKDAKAGGCSYGWCPCRRPEREVIAAGLKETIPTWPAAAIPAEPEAVR